MHRGVACERESMFRTLYQWMEQCRPSYLASVRLLYSYCPKLC